LAQPDSNSWSYNISFSGVGTIPDNANGFFGHPDPTVSLSLTGSGVTTAITDGGGGYNLDSSFTTMNPTIGLPSATHNPNNGNPSPSSFSPTTDPGITYTMPENDVYYAVPNPPFYGLYPVPAGTEYNASVSAGNVEWYYSNPYFNVQFTGIDDMILGPVDVQTQSGNVVTDTFAGSEFDFSALLGEKDPMVSFFGTVTLTTTVVAPDSSPGLAGILALLGVCVGGAWQKRARMA